MIRLLNSSDVDAFIVIRKEGLRKFPYSFGASPERIMKREQTQNDLAAKNDENFIFGFFEEDKLIGIVGFIRYTKAKIQHKGVIWGMYVATEHQGKGIGKKLMEATIEKARKIKGLQQINLSVTHLSKSAYSLYKKLKFVEYGIEKNALYWDSVAMDEIYMVLRVN